jgi:DnaJ-class molecular chaperone
MEKQKCDKCNGKGHIKKINSICGLWWHVKESCPKCKGFKTLDWVEMIKGKNLEEPFESSYYRKGTLSSGPR